MLLGVLLTACAPPAITTTTPQANGRAPVTAVDKYLDPEPGTLRPGTQVDVCIDSSDSYQALFTRARDGLVTQLLDLVQPGTASSVIRIHVITSNTYAESLPEIPTPALGRAPKGFKPTGREYEDGSLQRQATTQEDQFRQAHTLARQDLEAKLQVLSRLRSERSSGSDIRGCFQAAGDAHKGPRPWRIVIASDMEIHGVQQDAGYSLRGARIDVVFFPCRSAGPCKTLRLRWKRRLVEDGAVRPVRFHKPTETLRLFGTGASR